MRKYSIIIGALGVIAIIAGCLIFAQSQQVNTSSADQTDTSSTNSISTPQANSGEKTYTLADVATHNSISSCWMAISGAVYDVTKFIPIHPGGNQILQGCGTDATALFESQPQHASAQAQNTLPKYKIGVLLSS